MLLCSAVVIAGITASGPASVAVVSANETQSGTAEGTAELDVDLPDGQLDADETETIELFVTNNGELISDEQAHPAEAIDRATEARSVRVAANATDTDDLTVETGEQPIGTIEDGETSGPVTFDVDVAEDASGTYEIAVELEYTDATAVEYEFRDGDFFVVDEETETVTTETTVEVTVDGIADFDAFSLTHSVGIGEEGDISAAIVNDGTQDLSDAVITATAPDDDITLGGTATSETYIGDWDRGETARFDLRAAVADDATERAYPIVFNIEFEDEDGNVQQDSVRTSFTPDSRQEIDVTNISHNVSIDDQGTLSVTVQNGERRQLNNAVVVVESEETTVQFNPEVGGTPSASASVGDLVIFEEATAEFRVGTTADAIEREYPLSVSVEFEDDSGERQTTQPTTVDFVPKPEQGFGVADLDHSVSIGDDGILELDIENEGPINATEATVTVESQDTAIQVGSTTDEPVQAGEFVFDPDDAGSVSSEAFVGEWSAGETETLRFVVAATDDAIERNYPLAVTVTYEDENGTEMTDRTTVQGFQPFSKQDFAVDNVESTLRVGEDGDLEAELVNTGPRPVENVVFRYDDEIDNVFPRERGYAVGDLAPGESASVSLRFGVTAEAVEGPRAMEFVVRYRNVDGNVRVSDSLDVISEISPQRNRFGVTTLTSSVNAGGSDSVEFEVTNQADETFENIRMKLFTNDPLDSDDTEAFIPELAPGESTTIAFDLSVDSGAIARTYPVSMDFQFDDERGETKLSRTQTAPVEVTDTEDDGIPIGLLAIVGLILLGVVAVVARRYDSAAIADAIPLGDDDSDSTGGNMDSTAGGTQADGTADPLNPEGAADDTRSTNRGADRNN